MASVIRLKRRATGSSGAPASLANAEVAFNEVDNTLYYGKGGTSTAAASIIPIAGPGAYVDLTSNQTVDGDKNFVATTNINSLQLNGAQVTANAAELNQLDDVTAGTASASKALVVDANKDLDFAGGSVTMQDLVVNGDLTVNGTETIINTQTIEVEDKNIEMGVVATPSDATADGGGIILKGTTDKSILWLDASDSWTSSEHIDLASGKSLKINGTDVLSSTALGSGVVSSSLESVGTISSGTWQGTEIAVAHGGTGADNEQDAINTLTQVSGASIGQVLTKVGNDAVWSTPEDTGITTLNGLTADSQSFATGTSGSDFNIDSSGSTHTFNIPDASSSNRGLVTTGAQTLAGAKTFAESVTVDAANPNLTLTNTEGGRGAAFGLFSGNLYITRSGGNLGGNWPATINLETNSWGLNRYTPAAQLHVGISDASSKGFVVTAKASQSANLMELQNSDETSLFTVSNTGVVTAGEWQGTDVGVAHGGTGASDAATARENLGVEIGVDVQAQDARLQAIVDLSGSFAAGDVKLVGYSDSSTAEYVNTTIFGRSLMDDADVASAQATLELVPGTDVQEYSSNLNALAGLTSAADKGMYFTGSGTAAVYDLSSFGRTLGGSADASAARTSLELDSMALQASNNVDITGGSIDGITFDGGTF